MKLKLSSSIASNGINKNPKAKFIPRNQAYSGTLNPMDPIDPKP